MPFELRELHQGDGCNTLSLGDPALTFIPTAQKLNMTLKLQLFILTAGQNSQRVSYIMLLVRRLVAGQLLQYMIQKKVGKLF